MENGFGYRHLRSHRVYCSEQSIFEVKRNIRIKFSNNDGTVATVVLQHGGVIH